MVFSFIHPVGYKVYVLSITTLTSLIAILLLASLIVTKIQGFTSYFFGLLAIAFLIIFGSIFQSLIIGLVPDNYFTHHSMHIAVLLQAVFLALAVNDKIRIIRVENTLMQGKLVDALNHYTQNLISTIEAERHRLAIEIHDGLGQNLLTIRNIILRSQKQKMIPAKFKETLNTLMEITSDSLDDTRSMSYNLRPPILSTMGLSVAINTLVDNMRLSSDVKIYYKNAFSIDNLIAKEQDINIYRILQESFTNTIKHAQANRIDLDFELDEEYLQISYFDNGKGFDQELVTSGQGILSIKERVNLLIGNMKITSRKKLDPYC